jgi:hypothetical protein
MVVVVKREPADQMTSQAKKQYATRLWVFREYRLATPGVITALAP